MTVSELLLKGLTKCTQTANLLLYAYLCIYIYIFLWKARYCVYADIYLILVNAYMLYYILEVCEIIPLY